MGYFIVVSKINWAKLLLYPGYTMIMGYIIVVFRIHFG